MPGSFGTTNNDDGATTFTKSSAKSGIFARNDDIALAPANTPGGNGVMGLSTVPNASGVFGANNNGGIGVAANSERGDGMQARTGSNAKSGIFATNASTNPANPPGGSGVFGLTMAPGGAGVFGANNSAQGVGVHGNGPEAGVRGSSAQGAGVVALSTNGSALFANSERGQGATIYSQNDIGLFASGPLWAGVFKGALTVGKWQIPPGAAIRPSDLNGSIVIEEGNLYVNKGDVYLAGADCAEEFNLSESRCGEPGSVMVLEGEGELHPCSRAYDKKVAGVISGAGRYKPALVLDRQLGAKDRVPVAIMGKAYCKVDAQYGGIETGDLLTTSDTVGHAMKATDALKSFGAIIGKALRPLKAGQGLIPILVSLQ